MFPTESILLLPMLMLTAHQRQLTQTYSFMMTTVFPVSLRKLFRQTVSSQDSQTNMRLRIAGMLIRERLRTQPSLFLSPRPVQPSWLISQQPIPTIPISMSSMHVSSRRLSQTWMNTHSTQVLTALKMHSTHTADSTTQSLKEPTVPTSRKLITIQHLTSISACVTMFLIPTILIRKQVSVQMDLLIHFRSL